MQALLVALLRFDLLPAGFRNRELREAVAPVARALARRLQRRPDDLRPAAAAAAGADRADSAQPAVSAHRRRAVHLRWPTIVPRRAFWGPVLSATLDGESTSRLQAAVAAYDREVGHLWEGHALAA